MGPRPSCCFKGLGQVIYLDFLKFFFTRLTSESNRNSLECTETVQSPTLGKNLTLSSCTVCTTSHHEMTTGKVRIVKGSLFSSGTLETTYSGDLVESCCNEAVVADRLTHASHLQIAKLHRIMEITHGLATRN